MRLKISFTIDKGSDSYVPVYARSSILMRQSTPKSGRMIWLHPGESCRMEDNIGLNAAMMKEQVVSESELLPVKQISPN